MTRLYNDVNVVEIAKRISNEMSSVGNPDTIFLELGDNHPVLQLIVKYPNQEIGTANYIEFINEWDKLGLEKSITGLRYPDQIDLLCEHLPRLQTILGVTIMANAANFHPHIPVIARAYWFDRCYSAESKGYPTSIFIAHKRPLRIQGESEITRGLMEAMGSGAIDKMPDLTTPPANHKQAVMDILTPEQRALAEELIKSRDASKGIDYSDCNSSEEAIAKFAGTFGLSSQQVTEAVGPIGFVNDIDPEIFQRPATNGRLYGMEAIERMRQRMGHRDVSETPTGYFGGMVIPDTIEDPEAPEGYTYVIKTGKEHNLYPELKVKTSDTVEQLRKQCGMHHRQDFGDMNTVEISLQRNGPVLRMASQGKHMGVCANSAEQAKILLLGMADDILQKYVEKANLTMKEMQWSIQLLRDNVIEVKTGWRDGSVGEPVYFLDIFDVESISEYDMRKFQLMIKTQKTPEYKIEQMELNVAAHKQYMAELYKLMFYSKELSLEKRLEDLYFLIVNVNNFSNDQMVHFHIELGEGLIGEFEAPVDRGSWQTLLRLFEQAKVAVETELETGQDVTELAGVSFNSRHLGEEPMDVSERVDIFLEHQHDAFFVIPLEFWNGK